MSFSLNISLIIAEKKIRLQLAEDEARDLEAGRDFTLDENMTPTVLLSAGLDLEAEQYVPMNIFIFLN